MKCKVTAKSIRENYRNILSIGYCEAQDLLRYHSPFGYSCGVYGWNCDYYDINGVCIATGYRGMPGKSVNYARLKEYEKKAGAINFSDMSYESKELSVKTLLAELIAAELAD